MPNFKVISTATPAKEMNVLSQLHTRHSSAVPIICAQESCVLFGTADVLVLNRENDVVAVVDITSNEELCTVCNSTDAAVTLQGELAVNTWGHLYKNRSKKVVIAVAIYRTKVHFYSCRIVDGEFSMRYSYEYGLYSTEGLQNTARAFIISLNN